MRINELPLLDRPREKLQRKGTAALSDFELLEVLIGSGSSVAHVSTIARNIQKILRRGANTLSIEVLTCIPGISIAHASKLLAAFELARRHLVRDAQALRTTDDIVARLDDMRRRQQEHFVALSLDGGQRLIAQRTITIGTLDTVLAHPREVFSDPIVDRAAHIIIAHNHPSGLAEPSHKDRRLTHQLVAAGQLLGVPVRDHLILTKTEVFSFRDHHML